MLYQKIAVNLLRLFVSASALFGGLGVSADAAAAPVTYTIFAVTDVRLDGRFYHNAQVYLKFVGDTNDIQPFNCPPNAPCVAGAPPNGSALNAGGYRIVKGNASILIISGGDRVSAKFLPNQLRVTSDTVNGGAGFSSLVRDHLEVAYPLALANDKSGFSAPDLVTPSTYPGHAWSCIGYAPPGLEQRCANPEDFPLKTDHGAFIIYQPYSRLNSNGTIDAPYNGSINNGILSVVLGPTPPGVPHESRPSPTMSPF
ncbi:hypothetical protein [Paraburkholderia sediminicola]|uniref:hypothetical protein n=1 Tax=Paraburkholderia sediminicola TaxID=458836 RepID=UPI0038BC541F